MRAEWMRLRCRRAVLLLLASAVLVPGLIFAATVYNTRPVTSAELAAAQASVDRDIAAGLYTRDVNRCVRRPGEYGVPAADPQAACEALVLPRAEYYVSRRELDLREQRESGTGLTLVILLSVVFLLVGTTFVGHDWNSGSMSNQLLFNPRRSQVWSAKVAVVIAVGLGVALAVLMVHWTGLWAVAASRGVEIQPQAVQAAYKQAVLGAVFVALAGGAGVGLTMLFRSTVATLGLLLALSAVGAVLIGSLGLSDHTRLKPDANFIAYLVGSYTDTTYGAQGSNCSPGAPNLGAGAEISCTSRIGRGEAILYLGGVFLLSVVPSLVTFRRRDVP